MATSNASMNRNFEMSCADRQTGRQSKT